VTAVAVVCHAVLKSQHVAAKALTRLESGIVKSMPRLADSGDRHRLQDLRQ